MFSSLDYSDQYLNDLGDVTKKELIDNDFNNSTEISPNLHQGAAGLFLNITGETMLILCFYWTLTYQREQPRKRHKN